MLLASIFDSIFSQNSGKDALSFFIIIISSIITGFILALMCCFKNKSSKNFFITTALLPACVAIIIALVNGNIGAGIAVAGAFSLVRFRSAAGNAKEICIIFITVVVGLAFGMGYIAYAICFALILGSILMILSFLRVFDKKHEKILKITLPEDLDYTDIFTDLFIKYTKSYRLLKVKSANMGSLFKLSYIIELKNEKDEKKFLDEIRCRNGNLEVSSMDSLYDESEL